MTAIMRTFGVAAVLAVSTLVGTAKAGSEEPAKAGSEEVTVVFKPLQGLSLYLGSKHAIAYYVSDRGACELTLVVGDTIREDDVPPTTPPARFRAVVDAGRATRLDTGTGTELQFTCGPAATAMSVVSLKQVAYTAPRR